MINKAIIKNIKIRKQVIILFLFVIFAGYARAQNRTVIPSGLHPAKPRNKHKIGFVSSYGSQDFINVSYNYRVSFFQAQYYYTLLQKKTWSLEVLLQPQYNTTRYQQDNTKNHRNGYEAGVNAGLLVRKDIIKDDLNAYVFLSSGPHYVSGTPNRQAPGFIFSDNLALGLNTRIAPGLYLDLRSGFRHISNAGLKEPNAGVNNFVFSAGFVKRL